VGMNWTLLTKMFLPTMPKGMQDFVSELSDCINNNEQFVVSFKSGFVTLYKGGDISLPFCGSAKVKTYNLFEMKGGGETHAEQKSHKV